MNRIYSVLLALVPFLAASCSTSADAYVQDVAGYSVVKGRIVSIENLSTKMLEPLQDGVVLTIGSQECDVLMEFADGTKRRFKVDSGSMVVCGYDNDYVLRATEDAGKHAQPAH